MIRFALIATAVLLLAGCGDSRIAQATADSAATIYEAAVAIEQGVSPAAPVAAIKANAAAIIAAQGYVWPPPATPPATPATATH